jgi:hypothetical protein
MSSALTKTVGMPAVIMVALKVPTPGHFQVVHQVAGGEHRAAVFAIVGRVEELQHDLGGREGHAIEFEIAGFLHLAVGDRHVGDDGLLDVGLPDAHHGSAVLRNARRIHQPGMDGEGAGGGGQVAAIAAPVHKGLVDGDLAVEVVHIVVGHAALGQDHALAGAGGGAAHAVDVGGVGVGAADDAHEQLVARFARDLAAFGQVLQAEEHALLVPPRM